MQHSYYTKNRIHIEQIITPNVLSKVSYWVSNPKHGEDKIMITDYYPTKADEIYLKLYGYKCEFDSYYYTTKISPI